MNGDASSRFAFVR